MMSRRRQLSDEDWELWNGFARSITPLRRREPSSQSPPAGEKFSRQPVPSNPIGDAAAEARSPAKRLAKPLAKPPAKPPARTSPLAPLGRRLKARVARGREPIDARIDLHGMTQRQAHAALLRFLQRAQADGVRIALVVTGKGSAKGPAASEHDGIKRGVLRQQVPNWLALPEFSSLVIGFEDAHVGHGGEGALYVRLRRGR
jgi:DNA-nicking Smr family endonuclease